MLSWHSLVEVSSCSHMYLIVDVSKYLICRCCSYMSRQVQTCPNMSKHVQKCPDMSRSGQTCLEISVHCKYSGCKNCNYQLCNLSSCNLVAIITTVGRSYHQLQYFQLSVANFAITQIVNSAIMSNNICNCWLHFRVRKNNNFTWDRAHNLSHQTLTLY